LTDLRDSLEHPRFREVVAGLIEASKAARPVAGHGRATQGLRQGVRQPDPRRRGHRPPAEVLRSLTESLKWEDELASHTKKLLMYPAFVGTIVSAPPSS
jgi:type IV pilus assembly protein PilC